MRAALEAPRDYRHRITTLFATQDWWNLWGALQTHLRIDHGAQAKFVHFGRAFCLYHIREIEFGRFSWRSDFFLRHSPKRVSSTLGKPVTSPPNTLLHLTLPAHLTKFSKMSNLLTIAARVEAAVRAYNSVRDFADKPLWKVGFSREMVCTHAHDARDDSFDHPPFELEKC